MERRPVLTKTDFVSRYNQGEFGNRSPTWNSIRELPKTLPPGLYHLRSRIKGGKTWYDVPAPLVSFVTKNILLNREIEEKDLYVSAMCPTEDTILVGEVFRGVSGYNLSYRTEAVNMRQAQSMGFKFCTGLLSYSILKSKMDPNSFEWLEFLLEAYPDHIVEFTTLRRTWGTLPRFNTLFWEVRKY